jgi:hypothetical protein
MAYDSYFNLGGIFTYAGATVGYFLLKSSCEDTTLWM